MNHTARNYEKTASSSYQQYAQARRYAWERSAEESKVRDDITAEEIEEFFKEFCKD